jgi:hypothetical protein
VAGERVRLILNRLADIAKNRSSAYDSEIPLVLSALKNPLANVTATVGGVDVQGLVFGQRRPVCSRA